MRARYDFLILAILLHCCLPMASAGIVLQYDAGLAGVTPSPASAMGGNWIAGLPSTDLANFESAAVSPDGTTGFNAWRMLDNSTAVGQFLTWNHSLTPQQHADAATQGWRLGARLRVADPATANAGANSVVLIYGNNSGKRWILFLDTDSTGTLVATLVGGTTVTLTGVNPHVQNLHEIVFNPASNSAEYFVNGASKASNYGGTTGSYDGVQWGTGSSGGRGDGYWNQVTFSTVEPTLPPWIVAQPVSQSVSSSGSATISAIVENATTLQWFKNTQPVPGGNTASLTVTNATLTDAGDYWLRATNDFGQSESVTAALNVLVPGAGLQITEFLAENDGGIRDADGDQEDWIEIHNPSTQPANTAGWALTDNILLPRKWSFPSVDIPAGGFLMIFASGKARAAAGAELHTNFSLQNAGGYLALTRPDNSTATVFSAYPQQYSDLTFGLTPSGAAKYFRLPTPNRPNLDGMTAVRPLPAFNPPAATFSSPLEVTITSTLPDNTLRYRTDGLPPTFDSPAYTAPINLNASTNLRAAVVFPGERYGASATARYLRLGTDVAAFQSPLPIVVLHNFGAGPVPGVSSYGPNNDGSNVVEVPKQAHGLTILRSAAGNNSFNSAIVTQSRAGVKLRGSSSFGFARKSYALETWDEIDEQGRDHSLLGLPEDNDWVLYAPDPSQFDDVLIHNSLIYALARQSGYNAPRTRFVELFLNTNGGDITMANSRGLYLLVEKPKRAGDRVNFDALNADGTAGGWMINVDRMDCLPPGATIGSIAPRHFHTAGPDGILQTEDDNLRGYQGPNGGSGLPPPRDDLPNFYHSFFNFESPAGWDITPAQRTSIQAQMRAFDTALYGANFTDPIVGYARHIDSANWAQHLALHAFSKNQDAIVLSTFLFRESPSLPIKFGPLWDFDRAFNKNATSPGAATDTNWAHNRLFYPRLLQDPEFVQAYIDAWQQMRRGAFSNSNLLATVDAQAAEISSAVAARSGTTASAWTTNLANLKTWLTDRGAAFDALYTAPPVFSHDGGEIPGGFSLTIAAPIGSIYYTTDATDPRAIGGGLSPSALSYNGAIPITATTTITARARDGSAWSGRTSATFYPAQDLGTLRVTEIMYNPSGAGSIDGDEFEFLELQNTGSVSLDLGGLSFAGITFTFATGTMLHPGTFFLIVRNPMQFNTRYPGVAYQGIYTGKLDNSGESLALLRGGERVWEFHYGDSGDWPQQADNGGMSLQRPDPSSTGYEAATWTAAVPTPGDVLSLADADGDGMPNYWETLHSLSDPASDADGDNISNLQEFTAGTDPRNPASGFRLSILAAEDGVQLEFKALAARSYTIQVSDDLSAWQKLADIPSSAVTRTESVRFSHPFMKQFFRVVTPAIVGAVLIVPAEGDDNIALDPLFADHMVVQRDAAIPVWGTAEPGHEITVSLGEDSVATLASDDGKWTVRLPARPANKNSRELKVRANGRERLVVHDVLVGDVWICAGQSNMEFRTNQEATWSSEQSVATLPHVRLRNMDYAGQGNFATAYPAAIIERQTPAKFFNASSWVSCDATTAGSFSAVGYFFGKEMRNALDVPIGLIHCAVGGSPAEAWIRREALASHPSTAGMVQGNWFNNPRFEPWCVGRAQVQLGSNLNSTPGDDLGANHSFKPSFLWNAGPGRIAPYAIRGVLWYQGESNALSHIGEAGVPNPIWRFDQHEDLFPLLVNDWRAQWKQGAFPFLVCQLSSISETNYDSDFWPEFRNYQRRATTLLSNIGLAVTSDIGNLSNVHPTNKRDVGKRLANWARRYVHGDSSVLACPLPTSAARSGSNVTVHFNDAGTALATSNATAPVSFELAGPDGVFHPAHANIVGSSIVVTTTSVPAPQKVRYGWQPFSTGNLINSAGLPSSTFQLDVTP